MILDPLLRFGLFVYRETTRTAGWAWDYLTVRRYVDGYVDGYRVALEEQVKWQR